MKERIYGIIGLAVVAYLVISIVLARKATKGGFRRSKAYAWTEDHAYRYGLHSSVAGPIFLGIFMTIFLPSWIIYGLSDH